MPHELIPWERAAESDAARARGTPTRSPLPAGVRSALVVNLLTEDNLPYYFETINRMFANEVWREWARRWTAEEMRHAIVIRDYITVTHAVDLEALEHARMHQVCGAAGAATRSRGRHARVRRAAGARDAHLAPQHRQPARRRGRLQGDGARRRRREPALPLLPRPRVGRARGRPVGDGVRDRTPGAHVRDAGHRHPRLHRARDRDRGGRASTTSRCITIRCSFRSCCGTGESRPSRASTPRPSWRANGSVHHIGRIERVGRRLADRRVGGGTRALTQPP